MTPSAWLLTLPVIFPLWMAVLSLLLPPNLLRTLGRSGAVGTAVTTFPCLLWVWQAGPLYQPLGGWGAPLGIDFYLDGLACLLLLFTAFTGTCISYYAAAYFPTPSDGQRSRSDLFWPLWFVVWGGMNSLFLTLDLFNIYVTLELISVAGTGLILIAGTPGSTRAAFQYQLQALLAGMLYLLGLGLLYNELGVVDLQLIAPLLRPSPMITTGMALMIAGLLIKAALFPMHFWLPRAHADAPAPVSAVLSGLVVTAAFVVVFRLWFAGLHRIVPILFPRFLGFLGAAGILWGGLLALRQDRLKRLLAFSTVSQVGYLFLVFSLTFRDAPGQGLVWAATVYMAIAHGLAKAAAFMAAGALQKQHGSDKLSHLSGAAKRQPLAVMVLAVASINLIALPPSTGFIGKWMMLKAAFVTGQWGIVAVLLAGGFLAAAYLFRMFECFLAKDSQPNAAVVPENRALLFPAMLLALATLVPVLFIRAPEELLRIGAPVVFREFISPGIRP